MRIIPAIDLLDGVCVRLRQGEYNAATIFERDPMAAAARFAAAGAKLIHLVDLDGAKAGRPVQADLIRRVAATVPVPVEVGGGIRTFTAVDGYLANGVARVVLGSAAIEDPDLLRAAVARYGARVIAGIDARCGRVATDAWTKATDRDAMALAREMAALGIEEMIYTDIGRDGMLAGPDLEGLARLVATSGLRVIASGGVSCLADLEAVAKAGADGAIIGRALYDGRVDLGEAVRLWEGTG